MVGTLINSGAIVLGGSIGIMVHSRLSEKFKCVIFQALGLVTSILGISMALKTQNFIIIVLSIVLGSITGQMIDIDTKIHKLVARLTRKQSGNISTEGFVTTSLLFCVGAMAILGAFEDGMGLYPTILLTKSVMDGTTALFFATTFGISVIFSAIPVLIYQGALTLLAVSLSGILTEAMILELTAVGGVMLVGLGISIMKITKINVSNMLPSMLFAIIFARILQ